MYENLIFQDYVDHVKDLYKRILDSIPPDLREKAIDALNQENDLFEEVEEALNMKSASYSMKRTHVRLSSGLGRIEKESRLFGLIAEELAKNSGSTIQDVLGKARKEKDLKTD